MSKTYMVEKEWITTVGLNAVVILSEKIGHRCGYVAVKEPHPAFGKGYAEQLDCIKQEAVDSTQLGLKSPILILTATCSSDEEFEKVRRSLDVLIDVHGGITYSSSEPDSDYPIYIEGAWWFGYDCGHYQDNEPGGCSLEYCIEQCESLALQLAALEETK
jgi:hypothetical protein